MILVQHKENKFRAYAMQYNPNDMSRLCNELKRVAGPDAYVAMIQDQYHNCEIDSCTHYAKPTQRTVAWPWSWILFDLEEDFGPYPVSESTLINYYDVIGAD